MPKLMSTSGAFPMGHRRIRGFTLIELMVALVVGLLVTLAAIGFVVSVARANTQNIQATRLTQELRALSEVISREIRRARYVRDPIEHVGKPGLPTNNNELTVPSGGRCIQLKYDEPSPSTANVKRSIYLHATNGRIYLANDLGCGATVAGTPISSPEITIEDPPDPPSPAAAVSVFKLDGGGFKVEQILRGRLSSGPADTRGITRQFDQTIFIRSGEVN